MIEVKEWSTFYSVLGGATATLLGLLFVAVSLHGRAIHEEQNSMFFRLARLTLSNYLMLLSLSLQMLVPFQKPTQLTLIWIITAAVGLFWTIRLFMETRNSDGLKDSFIRRSYRVSFLAYGMLLLFATVQFAPLAETLQMVMAPVMILVFASIRNSWGLMTMVKPQDCVSS